MVYALFNHQDGTLQVARGGHPYPLHVPRTGELNLWKQDGLLIGVGEARFPAQSYHLDPGDKLLFYTDGVDNAAFENCPVGTDSLLACAERHRAISNSGSSKRSTRIDSAHCQVSSCATIPMVCWHFPSPAPSGRCCAPRPNSTQST